MATESVSLPRIGSGSATANGAGGSAATAGIDLGRLIGETLSRLIGEGRAQRKGDGALLRPDEDGRVSYAEFAAAIGALGLSASEGRRIFEHFDKSQTGYLSFSELHTELTTRVTERSRHLTSKRAAANRVAASPLNLGGSGPVSLKTKGQGPLPSSSSKRLTSSASSGLLSGGGIQGGLPISRSASSLMQAPSWDPVKGTITVESLKETPLWRDDAVTMSNGSRSLMRAVASMGQLSRPSVKQLEERHQRLLAKEQAKKMKRESRLNGMPGSKPGTAASTSTLAPSASGGALLLAKDPRSKIRTIDELIALRAGDIESVVGKIHDEELVEQQLDQSAKRLGQQVEKGHIEQFGGGKDIEKTLRQQSKIIEQRGNSLLAKANDVRAANFGLREIISRLRLERRIHYESKDVMEARLTELSKLVPALVDQCNLLLFEGEKVQSKVQQAHQDAVVTRSSQEDLLHEKAAEVSKTDHEIDRKKVASYEAAQEQARREYNIAKQQRDEVQSATSKLGYLQWKRQWWAGEFERLKAATGLELDFSGLQDGQPLDTRPIDEMMRRYSEQQADCASLERFLDSTTAEGNELELTVGRLKGQREARTAAAAAATASTKPTAAAPPSSESSSAHPHHPEVELADLTARCDELEATLRSLLPSTCQMCKALASPADFSASVREAEAARKGRYRAQAFGATAEGSGAADSSAASGAADAEEPAAHAEDEEAGASAGEDDSASGEAAASAAVSAAPPSPGAARAAAEIALASVLDAPSLILNATSEELDLPHNKHRVRLLDDALSKLEHELLAVHDACKHFRPTLDAMAFPHKSTAERLPETLLRWAGNPNDLDQKNVHAEFKRLAVDAEKRQREEAIREDAAAEAAREQKKKGARGGGSSPPRSPPKQAKATMGDSQSAAALGGAHVSMDASLGASASMPALGSPA